MCVFIFSFDNSIHIGTLQIHITQTIYSFNSLENRDTSHIPCIPLTKWFENFIGITYSQNIFENFEAYCMYSNIRILSRDLDPDPLDPDYLWINGSGSKKAWIGIDPKRLGSGSIQKTSLLNYVILRQNISIL